MLAEETVAKVMTSEVVIVGEAEPVKKALELMVKRDVGAIVVVRSDGSPVGIVTERDIVRRLGGGQLDLSKPAGEIMSKPLVCIEPETPLTHALSTMVDRNIRRLVVMKRGALAGIVVERDIIRWLARRPDVILDLISTTEPEVVKDAVLVVLQQLKLKERI